MIELEKYLYERGLKDALQTGELESLEHLQKIANLWDAHSDIIKIMLAAKIKVIEKEMLYKCIPQETIVMRQAMVEIAGIVNDCIKYSEEYKRAREINNNKQQ